MNEFKSSDSYSSIKRGSLLGTALLVASEALVAVELVGRAATAVVGLLVASLVLVAVEIAGRTTTVVGVLIEASLVLGILGKATSAVGLLVASLILEVVGIATELVVDLATSGFRSSRGGRNVILRSLELEIRTSFCAAVSCAGLSVCSPAGVPTTLIKVEVLVALLSSLTRWVEFESGLRGLSRNVKELAGKVDEVCKVDRRSLLGEKCCDRGGSEEDRERLGGAGTTAD